MSEHLLPDLEYHASEDIDAKFTLHCRDSSRLVFKINHTKGAKNDGQTFIYLIGILETRTRFVERQAYVVSNKQFNEIFNNSLNLSNSLQTNETFIEVSKLKPSESYNISATVISSDNRVYSLRTRIFTTLQTNYTPHNIVNITLKKFERDPHDDKRLNAHIEWQPARGL